MVVIAVVVILVAIIAIVVVVAVVSSSVMSAAAATATAAARFESVSTSVSSFVARVKVTGVNAIANTYSLTKSEIIVSVATFVSFMATHLIHSPFNYRSL